MTGIVDFALSKARTTLALAVVIIIAGAYANGVHQSKRRINFEVGFNF